MRPVCVCLLNVYKIFTATEGTLTSLLLPTRPWHPDAHRLTPSTSHTHIHTNTPTTTPPTPNTHTQPPHTHTPPLTPTHTHTHTHTPTHTHTRTQVSVVHERIQKNAFIEHVHFYEN